MGSLGSFIQERQQPLSLRFCTDHIERIVCLPVALYELNSMRKVNAYILKLKTKLNSVALVRKRTIPT
jgi:hypothetical protein